METDDRRVVACNLTEPTKIGVAGALCYLVQPNPGGGHDRVAVLVRSRGGRWVERWEDLRRLDNFRVKTLPLEHPRHDDRRLWDYAPDEYVEHLLAAKAQLGQEGE